MKIYSIDELAKAVKRRSGEKLSQYKVRVNMHEMKDNPKKFPGGRKQAIAIGLNEARSGKYKAMIKGRNECKKCGMLMKDGACKKCMGKSDVEKGGAGSRGGKVSRYTKSGKPVYASHDHKVATQLSHQAYQAGEYASSDKSHAEAARAHLAAAFYHHHAGNKVDAKEHLNNAEHHHAEAEKIRSNNDKYMKETAGSSWRQPSKSYAHKWVDKHIEATGKMIRGKNGRESDYDTSKSLAKAMQEERDDIMSTDIEAIFKGETEAAEDPMIEVVIGDGEDAETRLLPFSEIHKSITALRKGKKHKARTVAHENAEGRTTVDAGKPTSSRPGKEVKRQPKQAPHVTKGEGDEETSKEETKKGGEEEKKTPPYQVIKGSQIAMVVKDNTSLGDEAIAKSIAELNGIGPGAIPSMRNLQLESGSK